MSQDNNPGPTDPRNQDDTYYQDENLYYPDYPGGDYSQDYLYGYQNPEAYYDPNYADPSYQYYQYYSPMEGQMSPAPSALATLEEEDEEETEEEEDEPVNPDENIVNAAVRILREENRELEEAVAREEADAKQVHEIPWWNELIAVLIVTLAISAMVKLFLIQPFYVPSTSMERTLMVSDHILVSKMAPKYRPLNRGDIVVFADSGNWLGEVQESEKRQESNIFTKVFNKVFSIVGLVPEDTNEYLVKRVIGLPNDFVQCCDTAGQMSINGKSIEEGYLPKGTIPSEVPFSIKVGPNHIWVMGDNRQHSLDSRAHMDSPTQGTVPLKDVVGRAFLSVWPMERIRILSNSCAFYNIPAPSESTVGAAGR